MEKQTKLIIGLGNPGNQYAHTRHNVGFDVADVLARRWGVTFTEKKKLAGHVAEINRGDFRVVLAEPDTFMNLSGECVDELLNWYKAEPKDMLIIYDDIDLPPGRLRLRKNGSAGTHNGMKSVILCAHTQDFPRLRVGTGAPDTGWTIIDWVLGHYRGSEEQALMDKAFADAADCVECWLDKGFDAANLLVNKINAQANAKPTKEAE